MRSHCLLTKNDYPAVITMKFEQQSAIEFELEIHNAVYTVADS